MSSNFHYGDNVTQYGNHNVGMIKNQGPVDARDAFREMISAVQALRGQLSAADRQVIDQSMKAIGSGDNVEKGILRRALRDIAGVATMVGKVGVPVIEAVHAVMAAFGL